MTQTKMFNFLVIKKNIETKAPSRSHIIGQIHLKINKNKTPYYLKDRVNNYIL